MADVACDAVIPLIFESCSVGVDRQLRLDSRRRKRVGRLLNDRGRMADADQHSAGVDAATPAANEGRHAAGARPAAGPYYDSRPEFCVLLQRIGLVTLVEEAVAGEGMAVVTARTLVQLNRCAALK